MTSPKILNSPKKNYRVKYKQHCFFTSNSIVSGHMVSPVLPIYKNTFYYWNRLRICSSSFLSKHHFADHFEAVLISTLLQAAVSFGHSKRRQWAAVSVGLCALSLHPAESGLFNTSCYQHLIWDLYLCLCGNISLLIYWVRPTKSNTTQNRNPSWFHQGWNNHSISWWNLLSFFCAENRGNNIFSSNEKNFEKHFSNLRSMRSETQFQFWFQFYYPIFFPP